MIFYFFVNCIFILHLFKFFILTSNIFAYETTLNQHQLPTLNVKNDMESFNLNFIQILKNKLHFQKLNLQKADLINRNHQITFGNIKILIVDQLHKKNSKQLFY